MNTAFLFAGQGSQKVGMLHELPQHPVINETIEEASIELGENVLSFDTGAALTSTRVVQLALLIHGVATARLLKQEGATPDIVAGHSIGAFTAAVICGALSFQDALSIVELRGRLMQNAYPAGYGMGVILGLDERRVVLLTEKITSESNPVFLANLNAQDQITISGSLGAIEKVFSLARLEGAYTTKLIKVSVPSHCRLLSSVSQELTKKISSITLRKPTIPYVGGCRARMFWEAEKIGKDIAEGVANPVRWFEVTELMFERGIRLFVELGPGETLTNLAKKSFPEARCISAISSGLDSTVLLMKTEKK